MANVDRTSRDPRLVPAHLGRIELRPGHRPVSYDPIERGRAGARRFNPPPRGVAGAFFELEAYRRLGGPVQRALEVMLALVPDRAGDAQRLIELPAFAELSPDERLALLSPPKPDRLDRALWLLENPIWSALAGDKRSLFALDARVQSALIAQFEHFLVRKTGECLLRTLDADWFHDLDASDQIRALKVIAYASSQLTGASFESSGISQRRIIENTLDSLLPPTARFRLEFEDLPSEPTSSIAGLRRLPGTVVLNRNLIPDDDRHLGAGARGRDAEHVGLTTLVHEVNHLCNQIPTGATYAAFQDEYRAWFVGFVAFMSRFPSRIESLSRVKELLSNPAYAELQQALDGGGPESEQILRFLQAFGDLDSREALLALQIDNFVALAPLPDPMLDVNNGAS